MVKRIAEVKTVALRPAIGSDVQRPGDEGTWVYAIETTIDKALAPLKPDHDFMEMYEGVIERRKLNHPPTKAGQFLAIRMRIDDAHAAGAKAREFFDSFHGALDDYWRALFDPETDDIKPSVRGRFDIYGSNILLIYSICLLPEHRGQEIGLATAGCIIDVLGGGCCLVVCEPFGAQFCQPIPDTEFHNAMRLDRFTQDENAAVRRLRRYWSRLGFERLGRSSIYALKPD